MRKASLGVSNRITAITEDVRVTILLESLIILFDVTYDYETGEKYGLTGRTKYESCSIYSYYRRFRGAMIDAETEFWKYRPELLSLGLEYLGCIFFYPLIDL